MLVKARDAGVGVRRNGGIVLVKVLQAQRVFGGSVVIHIAHGQISGKSSRAGKERIIEMGDSRGNPVQVVVGDEPLARFAGKRRRVEQDQGQRVNLRGRHGIVQVGCGPEGIVAHRGQAAGGAVVGQANGNVEE
jgi:hypothetical protein